MIKFSRLANLSGYSLVTETVFSSTKWEGKLELKVGFCVGYLYQQIGSSTCVSSLHRIAMQRPQRYFDDFHVGSTIEICVGVLTHWEKIKNYFSVSQKITNVI